MSAEEDRPTTEKTETRRRRWPWVVGGIVLLLVVLVGLAPYLASTGWGEAMVARIAGDALNGRVALEDLSLNWTGPTEIRGFVLTDMGGRERIRIERATTDRGLWGLIREAENFDQITLDGARLTIWVDRPSPLLPPSKEPSRPKEPSPLPEPVGNVEVRDAMVTVVREDGRRYTLGPIEGTASLQTLNQVAADISIATPEGGSLRLKADIAELVRNDRLAPATARGSASLETVGGDVALGPLATLAGRGNDLAGDVQLQAEVNFGGKSAKLAYKVVARRLRSTRPGLRNIRPLDATLDGNATATPQHYAAASRITGEAGSVHAALHWPADAKLPAFKPSRIVQAALGGKPMKLPDGWAELNGRVDLPRLAQAVPTLLNLLPRTDVQSGVLDIRTVRLEGGNRPAVIAHATLRDLRATRDDRSLSPQPVTLDTELLLDPSDGMKAKELDLKSGFASVTRQQTDKSFTLRMQADLAAMHRDLGSMFDLSGLPEAGTLDGTLALRRDAERRVDAALAIDGTNIRRRLGQGAVTIARFHLKQDGRILVDENLRPTRGTLSEGLLTVDEDLRLTDSGSYDFATDTLAMSLTLEKADLAAIARHARSAGRGKFPTLAGIASGSAQLTRRPDGGLHLPEASATLKGLSVDGRDVGKEPISLKLEKLVYEPDGAMQVKRLNLTGPPATVTLTDGRLGTDEGVGASGVLEATGDLHSLLTVAAPFMGRSETPALWGSLTWNATATRDEKGFRLTGGGQVADLRVGRGERTVRRDKVEVKHEASISADGSRLSMKTLKLTAPELLTARIDGNVTELQTRRVMDLSGEYEAWWDAVNVVLSELAPDATRHVAFTGRSAGPLRVKGPISQPKLNPAFRNAEGGTKIGWKSGEVYGVPLGETTLEATLEEGQFRMPVKEVASGDGKLRLGGTVDFTGREPVYRLPGKVRPLEKVAITEPVLRELLGRINPVFMQATNVSGNVSLQTEDLELPLSKAIFGRGSGSGHLDLSRTRLVPSGLLGKLIPDQYLKPGEALPVDIGGVDFTIRDGRIHYRNFRMTFPQKFQLDFSGSAGLDGSLKLTAGVPVNAALLKQFGVGGKAATYARLLEGTVVKIPIRGTRSQPRLDFSAVDVKSLLSQVGKDLLRERATDLLKDRSDERKSPADPNATTRPAEREKNPVDRIFDLLERPNDRESPMDPNATTRPADREKEPADRILDLLDTIG
ncbi:MAG: hypothetical protein ACLFV7_00190 [Phycisphaerae bacterium]